MRYADAISELFALESRGIRMGVQRMRDALDYRGHPHRGLPLVHVAGTNGKGSVATMMAGVLKAAGYRVGLFTSPHLHRYVERVRIDGRPLSEREAARRISQLLRVFGQPGAPETTFFELTTLLALEAFSEARCDIAVMEVGLGGRLDATNATDSVLSVITRIAKDHMRFLGDDLRSIAREKAGIIKAGTPVVVGALQPETREVISRRARRLGAPRLLIGRDFAAQGDPQRFAVQVNQQKVEGLRLGLLGSHQVHNAACAVAGLCELADRGFDLSHDAIRAGLAKARWPGRLERRAGRPPVLFDAAHNVDGSAALASHIAGVRPRVRGRVVLVFGVMGDKQYPQMLSLLAPHFDRIYYVPSTARRGADPRDLARAQPGQVARSVADGLARARRAAGAQGLVVVAGSIFVVADARARHLGLREDPYIRM